MVSLPATSTTHVALPLVVLPYLGSDLLPLDCFEKRVVVHASILAHFATLTHMRYYVHMNDQDNIQVNERVRAVLESIERQESGSTTGGFVQGDTTLKGISAKRIKQRKLWIENGMRWGMTAEQISQYTEIMGDKVSRRQVLNYLSDIKKPKRYDSSGRTQHLHDYSVFHSFFAVARTLPEVSVVQFNKSAGEGARFRYDFKFRTGKYLFYGEVQLSDLAGTNWRKKMKNYVTWYEKTPFPFRVLWIIDQKRDLALIRYHAREVLKHRPNLNLFYFCTLNDIKNGTPKWVTVHNKPISLLD